MLESKLNLDFKLVEQARAHASRVADDTQRFIDGCTTVAVERTICRLLGIDGVDSADVPLPNVVVEHLMDKGALPQGAAFWIGNAMVETGKGPQAIAEDVANDKLDLTSLPTHSEAEIHAALDPIVEESLAKIRARRKRREDFIASHGYPRRLVDRLERSFFSAVAAAFYTGRNIINQNNSSFKNLISVWLDAFLFSDSLSQLFYICNKFHIIFT